MSSHIPHAAQRGFAVWIAAIVFGLCIGSGLARAAPDEPLTDRDISDAIEDEFLFDPAVPSNRVDIRTTDGIVHLTGTIDNVLAQERAGRIAETVKGVRSVVNRIEVTPPWDREAWEIQYDVVAALARNPATESWQIDVEVTDNKATLTGTVDSWREKEFAAKVAKGVRGVTGVDNRISVDYKIERPDQEIANEVREALRWDVLVDHALVDVSVRDGKVSLSGTVGSAAEKRQARHNAWVAGVTDVDDSGLEVKYWARNERLREDKYVVKSDEEIEKAIQDALLYDPRVLSTNVEADVSGGSVTLRGEVASLTARHAAEQDARNTVGVIRVRNRIKVRPPSLTDEAVQANLEAALARDPYVERYKILVNVQNGVARLSGTVDSYFEKGQTERIASETRGVTEVRNNLVVDYDRSPLAHDPYYDDYDPYRHRWYDYEPYPTFKTDEQIKEDIESQLWWSPFVDSGDVTVTVEGGVATLTGTVDTWRERSAAAQNAYEGGAVWVYNNLEVQ